MSGFEYVFGFYGLLMGLAMANVANGFGDMWRQRDEVRLGICTPAFAAMLVALATSQWRTMWNVRDTITIDAAELVITLGAVLPLVFVSQAMFPARPDRLETLDDHYLASRRALLLPLAFSQAIGVAGNLIAGATLYRGDVIRLAIMVVLPIVLTWFRSRWAHFAALLAMIAFLMVVRLFALIY